MDITKIGEKKFSAIMDIVVWQKVKNTETPPPSPFINVLFSSAYGHFSFCYNIDKGERGTFEVYSKFLPHIMSMIVVMK